MSTLKLTGLMPFRNEAHEIGLTLRAALLWCDEMIVLDHASTDASFEIALAIAREHPGRVIILGDSGSTWNEMEHRQLMLKTARDRGATHIAIVDADELLTGNLLPSEDVLTTINTYLNIMKPGECLNFPMIQLRGSLDLYHSNGIWGCDRWISTAFQDNPALHWGGLGDHHREPYGPNLRPYQPIKHGQGGIFHLWGLSEHRLIAKHALYKVSNRLQFPKRSTAEIEEMYNLWRSPEDSPKRWDPKWREPWTFASVPAEWWAPYQNLMKHLVRAPEGVEVWQETEVRRLLQVHGAEAFQGLDLFGIA